MCVCVCVCSYRVGCTGGWVGVGMVHLPSQQLLFYSVAFVTCEDEL